MSWPVFLCVLQLFWIKNPCLFIFSSPCSWIPVQQRDIIIHPKDERILLHGDAACACALSRWNLPFVEFAGEFCGLAAVSELHDAAILHLFRLGANYQRSMDLPDTTGLCWREGIYRCLGSYRSRVETSPRVSPLAPPSSSSSPLVPSSSSSSPLVPSSSSSSSLVLPSSSSLVPPSSSSSLLVPSSSSSSPLVLPSASSSPLVLPSSSSLVQLVFVSVGSAQFCATRAPPGTPGLVSGLWGDGLEPSTRACSSPAPSSADSSQVLSSSSAGPAQLIFVAAGSVQLSRASRRFSASRAPPRVGPVQLTFASAGPVQLTFASAGPVQLTFASAGPVQLTLASAGPVQLACDASWAPPREDELPLSPLICHGRLSPPPALPPGPLRTPERPPSRCYTARDAFLSISSVYDSPCMTWTVYWTLNLRCLHTVIISALFTDYPECLPPAPIISLNSDSDSALPTLCLKLVFELCLSDLLFVLIKLLLDLTTLPLRYKNKGASRCLEEHFFFV